MLSFALFPRWLLDSALVSVALAGSVFNTLPLLVLFFFFQKYFIQSIAQTGSKEG